MDSTLLIVLGSLIALTALIFSARLLLYVCLKSLYFIIYEIDLTYLVIFCLLLILIVSLLAVRMYVTNNEIKRLSFVVYKTEEEYELEKQETTLRCLQELKKDPRFKEVKNRILKERKEERKRASSDKKTAINFSSFEEQNQDRFVYENSD